MKVYTLKMEEQHEAFSGVLDMACTRLGELTVKSSVILQVCCSAQPLYKNAFYKFIMKKIMLKQR